jgi:hypothetical protein
MWSNDFSDAETEVLTETCPGATSSHESHRNGPAIDNRYPQFEPRLRSATAIKILYLCSEYKTAVWLLHLHALALTKVLMGGYGKV